MSLDDLLHLLLDLLGQDTTAELLEESRVLSLELLSEGLLPSADLVDLDVVEETVDTGVDKRSHDLGGHGGVLGLLEELGKTGTSVEQVSGGSVEIGTELGESGDLTVLGEVELERTGDRLHELGLGGGTDSGDGKTDVDSGSDTLEEELSLQEDLSVGNGDDVGGDISRDITTLGLNDG